MHKKSLNPLPFPSHPSYHSSHHSSSDSIPVQAHGSLDIYNSEDDNEQQGLCLGDDDGSIEETFVAALHSSAMNSSKNGSITGASGTQHTNIDLSTGGVVNEVVNSSHQSLGLSVVIPPPAPVLQRSVSVGGAALREYEARRQTLAEIISQIRYLYLWCLLVRFVCRLI